MIVLGISLSHDSGAAIVRDGVLVAAANEERFNREKSSAAPPLRSIAEVLRGAGLAARDIDHVAHAGLAHWKLPPMLNDFRRSSEVRLVEIADRLGLARLALGTRSGVEALNWCRRRLPRRLLAEVRSLLSDLGVRAGSPESFIDHHRAHLASAYFTSGFDGCLAVSTDGFGDGYALRAAVFGDGRETPVAALPMYHSIGNYYHYVTKLCGFRRPYEAGKVTGLAAYGDASATAPIFSREIGRSSQTGLIENHGRIFGNEIRRLERRLAGFRREDIAAGMQRHLEETMLGVVADLLASTGQTRLALAGGIYANVKLNQRIAALPSLREMFVHPHMGDGGLAVGAAFAMWAAHAERASSSPLAHVYLGPSISDDEARAAIGHRGLTAERLDDERLRSRIVSALMQGRTVAVCRGTMEYGPRALGHRSILVQATDPGINEWLNARLRRSEFMPFAPIVRDVDAPALLEEYSEVTARAAEFMTITYQCTEHLRKVCPAVVHVDGTARPQVLRRETNPFLYDTLTEYQQRAGLPVVINTSFNMHEEPIVCSADDAVAAFLSGDLDVLVLANLLVTRRGGR